MMSKHTVVALVVSLWLYRCSSSPSPSPPSSSSWWYPFPRTAACHVLGFTLPTTVTTMPTTTAFGRTRMGGSPTSNRDEGTNDRLYPIGRRSTLLAARPERDGSDAGAITVDPPPPSVSSIARDGGDPSLTLSLLMLEHGGTGGHGTGIESAASRGLQVWRTALLKGRLPLPAEFAAAIEADGGYDDGYDDGRPPAGEESLVTVWPMKPLFSHLIDAMATLQLPRLVLRHPDTVSAVLITLVKLTQTFHEQLQLHTLPHDDEYDDEYEYEDGEDEDEDMDNTDMENAFTHDEDTIINEIYLYDDYDDNEDTLSGEDIERLAEETAQTLVQQWEGVVHGSNMLDYLFGRNHGILTPSPPSTTSPPSQNPSDGFGVQDGVWQRTGWKILPDLQAHIDNMAELRTLLDRLGRRPTARPPPGRRDADGRRHRFPPRVEDREGGEGATFDGTLKEEVEGIGYSNKLGEMLPSEAVLLRATTKSNDDDDDDDHNNDNHIITPSPLRLLFLAKLAESKLLSYSHAGYTDIPSRATNRTPTPTPSAPGGPLLLCLDTSHSMSTPAREQLSTPARE